MKTYMTPSIEISIFEVEDVLLTSTISFTLDAVQEENKVPSGDTPPIEIR